MRSVTSMRTAKIGYIAISVLLCTLGVVFIAVPEFSITAMGFICGISMILFGAIRLVGYFSKDLYRLAFQYDLAFGILLVVLGVITCLNPKRLMNFICILLGLSFFTDGLFKLQIALDSKKFGIHKWWLILALAIVTGVFGLMLFVHPSVSNRVIAVLMGVALVFEGLLNLSTTLTAVKIIKHQQPDVIEVEFNAESEDD